MSYFGILLKVLVLGLVAALVYWLLSLPPPPKTKKRWYQARIRHENCIRHMPYCLLSKIFATLQVPMVMFIVYGAAHALKDGKILSTFFVLVLLITGTLFSLYQVFFTRLSYDDDYLYYQSPLAGNKKVPWCNLRDVRCANLRSPEVKIIVIDGIGRIWCSSMRNGYEELIEFLEWKMEEIFPEE